MKRIISVMLGLCAATVMGQNEITAQYGFTANKGYLYFAKSINPQSMTMYGNTLSYQVQQISTTTPTTVTVAAGVTTPGLSFFRNVSSNFSIKIDSTTNGLASSPLVTIDPGQCAQFPLGTLTFYAQGYTNYLHTNYNETVYLEDAVLSK